MWIFSPVLVRNWRRNVRFKVFSLFGINGIECTILKLRSTITANRTDLWFGSRNFVNWVLRSLCLLIIHQSILNSSSSCELASKLGHHVWWILRIFDIIHRLVIIHDIDIEIGSVACHWTLSVSFSTIIWNAPVLWGMISLLSRFLPTRFSRILLRILFWIFHTETF